MLIRMLDVVWLLLTTVQAATRARQELTPEQLRVLMTNLIFNAVDALPTSGSIRLRALVQHGQGIVEVIDSGIGMSLEVQERVFEPFYTTKGDRGTGLGLAHGVRNRRSAWGHIEVRSAPGAGTTVHMSCPLAVAPVVDEQSPPVSARSGRSTPLRILVVDYEPGITRAVARMLKRSSQLVGVAASGEQTLEKLAEQAYDAVVSDIGMGGGMNGWELAQAVRDRWPTCASCWRQVGVPL
jgi:hypothetical protein